MLEKTLILIKPDGIQRSLVGEIIKRFEQKGMKIIGLKMLNASPEQLGQHYPTDNEWFESVGKKTRTKFQEKSIEMKETNLEIGQRIRKWNMEALSKNPIIAIAFEGYHAVEIGRKIVGHTEPRSAIPGTIRGDFSVESFDLADQKSRTTKNLVHASSSVNAAEREIKVWFNNKELNAYEKADWHILH